MMNGPLSLEVALAPYNGEGSLVAGTVDGIRYLGSRFLVLREDAWDLAAVDPLLISGAEPQDMVYALADEGVEPSGPSVLIHPYFRWTLSDEHGLTLVPARTKWMVFDADTFVGVAAESSERSAVSWPTPLARTKRIVDVLYPMGTADAYEGPVATDWWQVWHYARLIDCTIWGAS